MESTAEKFQVTVLVPVKDEASATSITQRLQEATTLQKHTGAWVVVQRRPGVPFSGQVRIDFALQANTEEAARTQALEWTRQQLARNAPLEALPDLRISKPPRIRRRAEEEGV